MLMKSFLSLQIIIIKAVGATQLFSHYSKLDNDMFTILGVT